MTDKNVGITKEYEEVYKLVSDYITKTFKDNQASIFELVRAIEKVYQNKKIRIPFSEEDLQDLMRGETFDWCFDGVDVHLYQGEEE